MGYLLADKFSIPIGLHGVEILVFGGGLLYLEKPAMMKFIKDRSFCRGNVQWFLIDWILHSKFNQTKVLNNVLTKLNRLLCSC
jgi:hypothetical protein